MPRSKKQKTNSFSDQENLIDIWLPIESKIQGVIGDQLGLTNYRNEEIRRRFLQTLFQERDAGLELANIVTEAFGQVLRIYSEHVQKLLDAGHKQEAAEAAALDLFVDEPTFLRSATAYASAFQSWLVDHIARSENLFDLGNGWFTSDETHAIELVKPEPAQSTRSDYYPFNTSQEGIALLMSMCSGKSGRHWVSDNQDGTRTYQRDDIHHRVQLGLSIDERDSGLTAAALENLTKELDADGMFAVLYVSRLLAPPSPLPVNTLASAWIELDDVIAKIGWKPRTTVARLEMRRSVWSYLRFCARANLIGQRSTVYRDPDTKKEIPTRIDGPIWSFMKEEKPIQPSLFADDDVPLRVQIAVSPEWTRLTSSPLLAQFLPMGELLGQITPDQPSGAWARALGISLAGFWRRKPREALSGKVRPTRRELLTSYEPKIALPEEILNGPNPKRALEYWRGALQILVNAGFVEKSGEAMRTDEEMLAPYSRKGWQSKWMDEAVDIRPGAKMDESVRQCASNLPVLSPRNFKSLPRKKGRPRKTSE